MVSTITPELLYNRLSTDDSVDIVDTRPEESFQDWHLPGALNHPFSSEDEVDTDQLEGLLGSDDKELVTVCAKGISSYAFAEALENALDRNVAVVQDGMEGWSRVYDVISIQTAAPDIEIYQFQRVAKGCLGYLICSVSSHEAIAVDPTRHIDEFELIAQDDEMSITHVIDTHLHADHISGGRKLAADTGAAYYLPAAASERDVSFDFEPLDHTDVLSGEGISLKAIHVPGHTSDSTALLVNAEAVLTGDTLFVDSVGRTELQFGDDGAERGAEQLYESIQRSLVTLPDAVTVLPAHQHFDEGSALMVDAGEAISSTIRQARTKVPALQLDKSAFIDQVTSNVPEKPANYEEIMALNTGHEDLADDDEATELELGPNRCAAAD